MNQEQIWIDVLVLFFLHLGSKIGVSYKFIAPFRVLKITLNRSIYKNWRLGWFYYEIRYEGSRFRRQKKVMRLIIHPSSKI